MALGPDSNRLPCGVELERLIDQIIEHRPPDDPAHQETCPYCQTALHDLRRAWDDVQTLAHAPVAIPPGLTASVMVHVRSLARRAAQSIIVAGPRGQTRISHAVIAQIGRRAALAVPGILFATVQPIRASSVATDRVNLAIRVVASYGPALRPLADAVRARLRRRLPPLTGAEIEKIDVTFSDIGPEGRASTEIQL
jgi:uncharacterized alkaline shock family protein YloU